MRKDDVALLFDYLFWLRDRILAAAAQLPLTDFTSTETVATRDLRATLVHELDVQWSWRERLGAGAFPDADDLKPQDYETVAAVADHWRREEAEMRRWLDSLTEEQLGAPPPGKPDELLLWYYAMHLLSHGIQQFSEAAVLLTQAGHSPGDTGFLQFAEHRA